jgi:hypothetical protein
MGLEFEGVTLGLILTCDRPVIDGEGRLPFHKVGHKGLVGGIMGNMNRGIQSVALVTLI